ncbi:MAG: T9SS type A sorting domain-containing protein [Candidatus Cloacimonetes bacterium]|nr:T9SS type A sorting domain-containing protein [Candidatus Cloacimonadota bacterium]
MFRKKLFTVIFVLLAIVLESTNSEDFLIGDYSWYNDDFIMQSLQDANFNAKKRSSYGDLYEIADLLELYNNYNMDLRLQDYWWNTDDKGPYFATKANQYKFQAEFTNDDPGDPHTDKWFYRIEKDNTYQQFTIPAYPDNTELICDESTQGNGSNPAMAVMNIRPRPPMTVAWENGQPVDYLIGMIMTQQDKINQYIMKYHMRWNGNYNPDDVLCKVGLKICVIDPSAQDTINYEYEIPDYLLSSAEPLIYNSTELTLQNFEDNDATGDDYEDFIFSIDISELETHLENQGFYIYKYFGGRFRYFCPIVEYKDRGTLFIDYLEVEDDLHVDLAPEGTLRDVIANRTNQINSVNAFDNLIAFDSLDEPTPPHFDSYKIVEDVLMGTMGSYPLITAINAYGWDADSIDVSYLNAKLFDTLGEPEIISPDYYAYGNQNRRWNHQSQTASNKIQYTINRITNHYRTIRDNIIENNSKPFYPVVQTWGQWDFEENEWKSIMLPPDEQQKMLLFLPLCYGADGFYTFRMAANVDISGNREEEIDEYLFHGALGVIKLEDETIRSSKKTIGCINKNGDNWQCMDQYYAVQEANEEIETLGPIVRNLDLLSTGTIGTQSAELEFIPDLPELESISVEGEVTHYDGYVECGEYEDSLYNHYFMLVNRRTNFVTGCEDGDQKYHFDVNSVFDPAEPQEITFHFTDPMDNYHLVDQYSGGIYNITNYVSEEISIYPGDGKLLKLCQLPVPEVVEGLWAVENVYIPYDVTVSESGTLYIGDDVVFGPCADLTVQGGGTIYIYGDTYFGTNSDIKVYGTLKINHESLAPIYVTAKHDTWQGIDCFEGGQVWVENEACIEKAETGIFCDDGEVYVDDSIIHLCKTGIKLHNSTLEFISSNILIPNVEDAVGIFIVNRLTENNVVITSTEENPSIIEGISTERLGTGIYLISSVDEEEITFTCNFTSFKNLKTGISHNPYCRTDHEITDCNFENCDTGIQLFGTGSLNKIEDCDFLDNDCGINQNTVKTKINNCRFDDNHIGIDYENSQQGLQLSTGVYKSHFGYDVEINDTDIRCSDTSPEVENCIFKSVIGILSVNNSNVNASYDANNVFQTTFTHLMFYPDSLSFSSGILLHRGHNDFYEDSYDFVFYTNYNGSEITIDADGNWWEDFEVDSLSFAGSIPPTIIAESMDPEPNVPFFISPENRFESASQEESQGNDETALASFKEILNDKLESEKQYWGICIDKVYNLSMILEEDINALLNYYEVLYQSTPEYLTEEERTSLQFILKNYQKKCHIEMNEYQEAADIVVERINNPISTLDSLFAVMQLETIYMLSYMDSTGRGSFVVTSYDKLAPKTLKEHNQKHKDHWNEIYILLGVGSGDELEQNLPSVPVLSGNYPNPFNPETKIVFSIPEDSKVNLSIYNIRGQKVRTLVKTKLEKGFHEIIWNSKDNNRKSVATGVYFYKFDVNGKTKGVKKMLLLK